MRSSESAQEHTRSTTAGLTREMESMSESHIDYDQKVQNALRGVVRSILEDTAENGLIGEHHFYIAFKTRMRGVQIPKRLLDRFPDEMTIVLQHKFWGLKIHDDYFEVGLSFNQKPEHLVIPFEAIVGFVDPSVQFALQFHEESEDEQAISGGVPFDNSFTDTANSDNGDEPEGDVSESSDDADAEGETGNVVTLETFRNKR